MKTTKWIVAIAGMALPLLYLNCQGSFETPSTSTNSSMCIPKSQSLASNKILQFKPQLPGSKLLLSHNPFSLGSQQKLNISPELGVPFSVLLNPTCVKAFVNPGGIPNPISQTITSGKRLDTSVEYQSFSWTIITQSELDSFENQINDDTCVYAAGLEMSYQLSTSVVKSVLNDPKVEEQAHLNVLKFNEAYPVFYNADKGLQNLSIGKKDVVVAIIDTGTAYTHKDLINNMWQDSDGHVGINATNLGVIGAEEDYDPFEVAPNSHGTHVSGIIAAEGNNGVGGTGLAPAGVKIMSIRIFNSKEGSNTEIISKTTDVVSGIMWATDHGADVINLSLAKMVNGTSNEAVRDEILELAIQYAIDNGVFLVFAAGNSTNDVPAQALTESGFSILPARYGIEFAGAITVGSIDVNNLKRSSFSHFSPQFVEIGAPGQEIDGGNSSSNGGILSTASPVFVNNIIEDKYARLYGTSMSAPMVSAGAALIKGLIRQNKGLDPSPAEIERIIKQSSLSYSHLSNDFENGKILDLSRVATKVVIDYELEIPLGDLANLVCP